MCSISDRFLLPSSNGIHRIATLLPAYTLYYSIRHAERHLQPLPRQTVTYENPNLPEVETEHAKSYLINVTKYLYIEIPKL